MDNLNLNTPGGQSLNKPTGPGQDPDKPIPLDDSDKPIPFDVVDPPKANVSHAPLNLGGAGAPAAAAAQPAARIQVAKKPAPKVVSSARISGVRTFFTKLHPGAIEFLDEQINTWLKQNPGISIKRTNVTTGDIQSKKTEPNIIVTIWY